MDPITSLNNALASLLQQFQDACANPKPTYSVDGQSVSWSEYIKMLSDAMTETLKLLGSFDPQESRTIIL